MIRDSLDMLEQSFRAWSAMIRECCMGSRHWEGVSLFIQKARSSVDFRPSTLLMAAVIKSCSALSATQLGKALHGYVLKKGHFSSLSVSKAMLNMYAKFRALDDCEKLFGELGSCDIVTWNILLAGFASSMKFDTETMDLFKGMLIPEQPKPSPVTISIVLPVCARSGDLVMGKSVHSLAVKSGMDMHTLVGNSLVSFYAKCGQVTTDAFTVFAGLYEKDVVSWNAIISGFAENGLMYEAFRTFRWMLRESTEPNYTTIATIFPICASQDENAALFFGREIHAFVLRRAELSTDIFVCNALLMFYLRTGQMQVVETLFRRMQSRDSVTWNSVIAGCASNGEWSTALTLFQKFLLFDTVTPDSVTFVSILPICAVLKKISMGKQIHGYIVQRPSLAEDTTVGNALVNFYAKCDEIDAAFQAFLMIPQRDIISWNSMLDAFVNTRNHWKFLNLLAWMLGERFKPDGITILTLINFCISISRLMSVKEVHCYSIRYAHILGDGEPTIGNAMLVAYAKCGDMGSALKIFQSLSGKRNLVTCNSIIAAYVDSGSQDDAYKIFSQMHEKDVTTWNLMIRVYALNNCVNEALYLFHEFRDRGMDPDELTIMSLLAVFSQMASAHLLRQCHGYLVRNCFEDVRIKGALLDVYSKCGSIWYAYNLFQSNPNKDLFMFTAMIGGFAMHGMGEEALEIFHDMIGSGIKPDHIIFTSVLSACSHGGLIDPGLEIFYSMEKLHGMKPKMEQYACVVDLLARGGRLSEAYSFVAKMPIKPAAHIWGTLLGACKSHHEVELGRVVGAHLFESESDDIGNYIVLSNLYAAEEKWDEVLEMRKLMKSRDFKKPAGCSWIEVERRENVFVAGDTSHPERSLIYDTLLAINQHIKEKLANYSIESAFI
ncbi:hypothetical protein SAY87_020753 [Trapa incisa]|uniref:Chlororespiratory reduction 21 n=1 Tax=Trapa incisa TaxID=236973 RepID=A0AAN7PUP7_9MYRT|nr:hypothetical protein SAY87_020753 [Trapa incisa]